MGDCILFHKAFLWQYQFYLHACVKCRAVKEELGLEILVNARIYDIQVDFISLFVNFVPRFTVHELVVSLSQLFVASKPIRMT